jgi:hypothetical protein
VSLNFVFGGTGTLACATKYEPPQAKAARENRTVENAGFDFVVLAAAYIARRQECLCYQTIRVGKKDSNDTI